MTTALVESIFTAVKLNIYLPFNVIQNDISRFKSSVKLRYVDR